MNDKQELEAHLQNEYLEAQLCEDTERLEHYHKAIEAQNLKRMARENKPKM